MSSSGGCPRAGRTPFAATDRRRGELEAELAKCDQAIERLTDAIVEGGILESPLRRLRAQPERRERLIEALAHAPGSAPQMAPQELERRTREKVTDWRWLLLRNVDAARDVLRVLLAGPLRFTPVLDGQRRGHRFSGEIVLNRLLSRAVELPKH